MMIEAGTLCIVYRVDHKCSEWTLGKILVYDPIPMPHIGAQCTRCAMRDVVPAGYEPMSWHVDEDGKERMVPARWLKPLPPLDEPVETERETVA